MLFTGKSISSISLLKFVHQRVTIRALSYSLMKHSTSDSEGSCIAKKPRINMIALNKIKLTPSEEKLKAFLLDVTLAINERMNITDKVILRFAGGWVRDKLLDIPSNDIDVAINSLTGSQFTDAVFDYLGNEKCPKKYQKDSLDVGRCYTTGVNSEKSKHLETSTLTLLGYDIDFVNLRKETYTDESRNPQMQFGTPEEDVSRRDCTINALFYNIHTDEVEDFIGGLRDLEVKQIKTPVDPKTTFLDDPLRILRLIRFANRLDFDIDPKCEVCMSDVEVLDAFHRKVSRERVQIEIMKIMKGEWIGLLDFVPAYKNIGKNPCGALELIERLGLYFAIFTDALSKDAPIPDISSWRLAYGCLRELMQHSSLCQPLVQSHTEMAWLLAAYVPWSTVEELPDYVGKRRLAWGGDAARLTLRLETKKFTLISGCLKHCRDIICLKKAVIQRESMTTQRDVVGNIIRRWNTHGNWRLQVLFSIMVEFMNRKFPQDDLRQNCNEAFREWEIFLDHLEEIDLMDAPSIKNVANGKMLANALGLNPGLWVATALEQCMNWTLRNPGVEDPTEAIEEVKKKRTELGIPEM